MALEKVTFNKNQNKKYVDDFNATAGTENDYVKGKIYFRLDGIWVDGYNYAKGGGEVEINETPISGITTSTNVSLGYDDDGKLMLVLYSPIIWKSGTIDTALEYDDDTETIDLTATASKTLADTSAWTGTGVGENTISGSTITNTATLTKNSKNTFTVTLVETDGAAKPTKTVNVTYPKYQIEWGYSVDELTTFTSDKSGGYVSGASLLGGNNVAQTNKTLTNKTVTYPAGTEAYVYVFIPKSFGTPTFYIANAGGDKAALSGGFVDTGYTFKTYSNETVYSVYKSKVKQTASMRIDLV